MLKFIFRKNYKQKLENALTNLARQEAIKLKSAETLSKFSEIIEGFFSDWTIDKHTINNYKYCLWIANSTPMGTYFRDYGEGKNFLSCFTEGEKLIIWNEVQNEIKRREVPTNEIRLMVLEEIKSKHCK